VSFVVDESLFYIGAYLTGKKKRRQVGLHAYLNNEQYALASIGVLISTSFSSHCLSDKKEKEITGGGHKSTSRW
jgi:hypothetical protein